MTRSTVKARRDELHDALDECMNCLWGVQAVLKALLANRDFQASGLSDVYGLASTARFHVDAIVHKHTETL